MVGSPALREWNGARAKRVDDLLNLHAVVGGHTREGGETLKNSTMP